MPKRKEYQYTGKCACLRRSRCAYYVEDLAVITTNEKEEKPIYGCRMTQFNLTHNPMMRPKYCYGKRKEVGNV